MSRQNSAMSYAALLWLVFVMPVSAGSITDFENWTKVEDPPHAGMTGTRSSTQVTLTAIGPVPAGTDIGYQSVNGNAVAGSSSGNYFSAGQDFHIAVDFAVNAAGSSGFAAIGFGIGEDIDGMNSAGPLLGISNGNALGFFGGARTNDVTDLGLLSIFGNLSGRFFVSYDSPSGNIIYGVGATGSLTPSLSGTFSGLQNNWNNQDLLVSLFLRSDELIYPPLSINIPSLISGEVSAVFSNFTVLDGAAVSVVPLPAAVWLFAAALGGLLSFRGRRRIVVA